MKVLIVIFLLTLNLYSTSTDKWCLMDGESPPDKMAYSQVFTVSFLLCYSFCVEECQSFSYDSEEKVCRFYATNTYHLTNELCKNPCRTYAVRKSPDKSIAGATGSLSQVGHKSKFDGQKSLTLLNTKIIESLRTKITQVTEPKTRGLKPDDKPVEVSKNKPQDSKNKPQDSRRTMDNKQEPGKTLPDEEPKKKLFGLAGLSGLAGLASIIGSNAPGGGANGPATDGPTSLAPTTAGNMPAGGPIFTSTIGPTSLAPTTAGNTPAGGPTNPTTDEFTASA